MSVREGMDVARVREIANQLGAEAERLREVRGRGTASWGVLDDVWEGADAEQLRGRWQTSANHLEQAANALRHARDELARQASDQDEASGGGGSGPGGPDRPPQPPSRPDDDRGPFGLPNLPNPFEAAGDAWDWVTDRAGDAWDWATDRGRDLVDWGRDGLEWVGDRARDLWDAGRSFWDNEVVTRWESGLAALERLGPSITNFASQFTQIFTEGRWPRFHEVLASAVLLLGRTGGLAHNLWTGEDGQWFHSGDGVVISEMDVPDRRQLPDGTWTTEGRMPTDLNGLMDLMTDTYDRDRSGDPTDPGNRHVRVTEVTQPDGSSAFIVTVPGTNGLFDFPGSITGGDEAFDNTSNLELQAGQRSASMEAVMAAMEQAGIPPGAPVMLQGHSQGGLVTAELTQDAGFMDRYNVTHMITQGSPNDSRTIPSSVQTLAIEHTNDPVPMVDLGDSLFSPVTLNPTPFGPPVLPIPSPIPNPWPELAGSGDHVTQSRIDPFPGVTMTGADRANAHHYINYADSVARELAAGNPDYTGYVGSSGFDVFITDDPSRVTTTEYGTGRR